MKNTANPRQLHKKSPTGQGSPRGTIIPIASGKGGVGKSVITANLAIALARLGHDTLAVDLDLGGSNLHSYLGLGNKHSGIGDFLKGRKKSLPELIVPTKIPKLRFLAGDGRTPFMANIPFQQRLLLLNELQKVKARYILLDLGAGSTFNTLNFFGLSHHGMIVTTFESPAIMNMLTFLKNFMFRLISAVCKQNNNVFKELIEEFRRPVNGVPVTVASLLTKVGEQDQKLARTLSEICQAYSPGLVFNMTENIKDLDISAKISQTLKENISLTASFCGCVSYDNAVRRSVRQRMPIILARPDSPPSRDIIALSRYIASGRYNSPHIKTAKELRDEVCRRHQSDLVPTQSCRFR